VQKFCTFNGFEYISDTSNGMQWFIIKSGEIKEEEDNDIMF
jgi:hypothetical protein